MNVPIIAGDIDDEDYKPRFLRVSTFLEIILILFNHLRILAIYPYFTIFHGNIISCRNIFKIESQILS